MFIVITMAYLIFWGPLFIVTLANYTDDWKAAKKSMAHEVPRSFPLTLIDLGNLAVMADISVQKNWQIRVKDVGGNPVAASFRTCACRTTLLHGVISFNLLNFNF